MKFTANNINYFMESYSFQKEYANYLDAIDRYMMGKGTDKQMILEFE